jgi:hypothetical protein
MATAVLSKLPPGAGADMYDAVNAKVNVVGDPPPGLIVHCAVELEGVFCVFDIWQTAEDGTRFREDRVIPAIRSIVGEEAFAAMPDAERPEGEVHDLQIP